MKKLPLTVITLFVLTSLSCKEIRAKLPAFSVSIPVIKLTVPPIKFVSDREVPIGALRMPINIDSVIKNKTAGTFNANDVQSVKVKKLVITLANADEANNLANFERARMRLYSSVDTSFVDIAVIDFPQTYSDSVSFTPENSPEILSYLKGSEIIYNLYWKNRKPTTKSMKLAARITLAVK